MAIQPNSPIFNKGELYVSGLGIAYASGTTLSLALGQARDSQNINDISLSAAATINGAVIGAVNGLDAGALANDTFYAVYVIGDSNSNYASGGLLSTSFTAPRLPFGYDMFRRVGVVLTGGAATIKPFVASGDGLARSVLYNEPVAAVVGGAGAATDYDTPNVAAATVTVTTSVPRSADQAIVQGILVADAGAARTAYIAPNANVLVSAGGTPIRFNAVASATVYMNLIVPVTNTANVMTFVYAVSDAAATFSANVAGYIDNL